MADMMRKEANTLNHRPVFMLQFLLVIVRCVWFYMFNDNEVHAVPGTTQTDFNGSGAGFSPRFRGWLNLNKIPQLITNAVFVCTNYNSMWSSRQMPRSPLPIAGPRKGKERKGKRKPRKGEKGKFNREKIERRSFSFKNVTILFDAAEKTSLPIPKFHLKKDPHILASAWTENSVDVTHESSNYGQLKLVGNNEEWKFEPANFLCKTRIMSYRASSTRCGLRSWAQAQKGEKARIHTGKTSTWLPSIEEVAEYNQVDINEENADVISSRNEKRKPVLADLDMTFR
ncbi:hypothetical protein LguiA_030345 [Lonicera macranthoides]